MGKKFNFDYVVIGGGPASITAALILSKNKKKKILLVKEKNHDEENREIPYLASLNFAHNFYNLKKFPELANQDFHYNLPSVATQQEKLLSSINAENKQLLKDAGITEMSGSVNFLNPHTIAVGNKKITSKFFVLSTGSKLNTDGIISTSPTDYYTPNSIMKVHRMPKFILIVGGGSTGCELAEYYTKLGAKVILMEKENRILPKEDAEASYSLCEYFEHELGIMVIKRCKVVEIANDGNTKRVIFSTDEGEKMIRIDCIVLATGTKPTLDYGLENAGVKFNKNGILVNKFFQTSVRNIFAIGESISNDFSTERANLEALLLANNLLKRSKNTVPRNNFVRITATDPEIASIGKAESYLIRNKIKHHKTVVYLRDLPASKIYHENYGFVKIITDSNKRIIGASIMAPHASDMISEFAIAIEKRLTIFELANISHSFNNFSYMIKLAAKKSA